MKSSIAVNEERYTKVIQDFGTLTLRRLDLETDISVIHDWVTKPYAQYWGMQEYTVEAVKTAYRVIENSGYHKAFIGSYNGVPAFLMEYYEVSKDRLAAYYDAKVGDYGMHLLVAPAKKRIPKFTWNVFSTVLDYFFDQEPVKRVVVEPDVNNTKIHKLNKKAGFRYQKEIELPEKRAALAFCRRSDFVMARFAIMTE